MQQSEDFILHFNENCYFSLNECMYVTREKFFAYKYTSFFLFFYFILIMMLHFHFVASFCWNFLLSFEFKFSRKKQSNIWKNEMKIIEGNLLMFISPSKCISLTRFLEKFGYFFSCVDAGIEEWQMFLLLRWVAFVAVIEISLIPQPF